MRHRDLCCYFVSKLLFLVSYLKFAHAKMCFVFKWIQDGIVTFRGDGNQSEDRRSAANPRQGSIC